MKKYFYINYNLIFLIQKKRNQSKMSMVSIIIFFHKKKVKEKKFKPMRMP